MPKLPEHDVQEVWHAYLTTGQPPQYVNLPWFESHRLRPLARWLPASPRCRICQYPFAGVGGLLARVALGIVPSKMNPLLCNVCERFADDFRGGAEVEASLVFADVRGSTQLAAGMSPREFGQLIGRYYRAATHELYHHNGMVEKLIGDGVTGFFVPGFAGPQHAQAAVLAGKAILEAVGHTDRSGPWIPVGVGVHTGTAYIGSVGTQGGGSDIVVLGDTPNLAARVAAAAGPGELVITDVAWQAAGLNWPGVAALELELKGRQEAVKAWVWQPAPG